MKRTQWAIDVHAAMLASGESLTCAEIVAKFGPSPGKKPVANRMWEAANRGWYSVEKVAGSICNANRYKALPREDRYDWTPERCAALAKVWPTMGVRCAPMFAPATVPSVQKRAAVMTLRMLPSVKRGKGGHPPPKPPAPDSRDGLPRVRSVFELGAA